MTVRQGAVLDSAGIVVISQEAYNQCYPAVGFDGTELFAVWQDYRSGSDLDMMVRG